jgi:hypothetical protein
MHAMTLLGYEAQVEALFGPFRDSANLDAIKVHGLGQNISWPQKPFLTHQMELLGDVGRVESHFGPFGDSVSVSAR